MVYLIHNKPHSIQHGNCDKLRGGQTEVFISCDKCFIFFSFIYIYFASKVTVCFCFIWKVNGRDVTGNEGRERRDNNAGPKPDATRTSKQFI